MIFRASALDVQSSCIRDDAHGKKERKQSTMVKVKADLTLYATLQTDKQTLED